MKRVGIVSDRHVVGGMAMHTVNDEYVTAIRDAAGALPLLIPSTDIALDPAAVLADPHVKRAYLGEEDETLVDPDDLPARAESAA